MLILYGSFFITVSLLTYAISGIFKSKESEVEQRIETYFDSETAAIHAIAFALPNFFLKKTMEDRGERAVRELPDILDLLMISLEAASALAERLVK